MNLGKREIKKCHYCILQSVEKWIDYYLSYNFIGKIRLYINDIFHEIMNIIERDNVDFFCK